MANRVQLIATTFIDKGGTATYGYRLFDECDQTYGNHYEKPIANDMDLLQRVINDEDDKTAWLLAYAEADGIYVNSTWYGTKEIAPIFANKGTQSV